MQPDPLRRGIQGTQYASLQPPHVQHPEATSHGPGKLRLAFTWLIHLISFHVPKQFVVRAYTYQYLCNLDLVIFTKKIHHASLSTNWKGLPCLPALLVLQPMPQSSKAVRNPRVLQCWNHPSAPEIPRLIKLEKDPYWFRLSIKIFMEQTLETFHFQGYLDLEERTMHPKLQWSTQHLETSVKVLVKEVLLKTFQLFKFLKPFFLQLRLPQGD